MKRLIFMINPYRNGRTHEYLLQGIDRLIGHRYSVNFSDLIADVKCRLSVDHSTVHNSCHHAFPILVHF